MMMSRPSSAVIATAAAAGLLLVGCSVTSTSSGISNAAIEEGLAAETGESVTVRCPEEIPLQSGLVSRCPATIDGANAVVVITQVDDSGKVDWSVARTVSVDGLPLMLESEIGVPVQVECPADIPLEEGLVVECLVSDGESEGIVFVTQTDNLGNISWTFG